MTVALTAPGKHGQRRHCEEPFRRDCDEATPSNHYPPSYRNFNFRDAKALMRSSSKPWANRLMLVSPYSRS